MALATLSATRPRKLSHQRCSQVSQRAWIPRCCEGGRLSCRQRLIQQAANRNACPGRPVRRAQDCWGTAAAAGGQFSRQARRGAICGHAMQMDRQSCRRASEQRTASRASLLQGRHTWRATAAQHTAPHTTPQVRSSLLSVASWALSDGAGRSRYLCESARPARRTIIKFAQGWFVTTAWVQLEQVAGRVPGQQRSPSTHPLLVPRIIGLSNRYSAPKNFPITSAGPRCMRIPSTAKSL